MSNSWFAFKQFTIRQEHTAMKVTTDGVLLGAWARVDQETSAILDIGTGTGLVAIMMGQRSGATIDALEIEAGALQQAEDNVRKSPWGNRINVIGQSFSDFATGTTKKYDLLVCNPPWFRNSLPSTDENRRLARHVDKLSPESLLDGTHLLLGPTGRLALILPAEDAGRLLRLAQDNGLYCSRECGVIYKKGQPVSRILMELSVQPVPREKTTLLIEDNGFTPEYRELTGDFYLKF